VHTRGRGQLRAWWWPVGPKLVFDQIAPYRKLWITFCIQN
jgi:hypothetical protein